MTFEYEPLAESIAVHVAQRAPSVDRGEFPTETLHELGDAGLLGLISAAEELLLAMSYDDPAVRPLLDMEGLTRWLPGRTSGYALLERAVDARPR